MTNTVVLPLQIRNWFVSLAFSASQPFFFCHFLPQLQTAFSIFFAERAGPCLLQLVRSCRVVMTRLYACGMLNKRLVCKHFTTARRASHATVLQKEKWHECTVPKPKPCTYYAMGTATPKKGQNTHERFVRLTCSCQCQALYQHPCGSHVASQPCIEVRNSAWMRTSSWPVDGIPVSTYGTYVSRWLGGKGPGCCDFGGWSNGLENGLNYESS